MLDPHLDLLKLPDYCSNCRIDFPKIMTQIAEKKIE